MGALVSEVKRGTAVARPRSVRRRTSQADVARAAGVSPGIVSSVINNKSYGSIRVSEATRLRVLAAVEELGYVPNLAARSMAGGTNRIIGVFTYESVFPMGAQNFYHEFLVGIEDAADAAEHNLLLVTGARRDDRRSLFPAGVNGLRLADGGLLLGATEDTDEVRRLAREGYPFVFVGERHYPDLEPSYTAADYVSGTADVVARVHAAGHRRIALLNTHHDPVPGRVAGFELGRERLGLSAEACPVVRCHRDESFGPERMDAVVADLLERGVTAVVAQGGSVVEPLWDAIGRRGLHVPRDLSLIGLEGNEREVHGLRLTDLQVPRREMGRTAVRLLLTLVTDPDAGPLQERLACGFREGDTLAAPVR